MLTDVLDLTDGGEFNWTGGSLQVSRVEGSLENQGGVLSSRNPFETTTVMGDYVQEPDSQLLLRIGGREAAQFDTFHVTGEAVIEGDVVMKFGNGFAPRAGDEFALIMANELLEDDGAIYRVQNLAPSFQFDIIRDGQVVKLLALNDGVFVPEPSILLLLLTSVLALTLSGSGTRRRLARESTIRKAPYPLHSFVK